MTHRSSFRDRRRRASSGPLRRLLARAAGDEAGVAAVEFAMLVPVLVLMVMATADIGLGIYRKMQVEQAAQAGAEWAIRNGFDADGISNAVTSATNAQVAVSPAPSQFCGCATSSGISAASCGTPCPSGAQAGTYATVSAQMTYTTTLNYGVAPSTYNFNVQSTVRLQ